MPLRATTSFRAAINTGAPGEAELMLETLRREVETAWRAAASPEERRAISTEVTALLEWARQAIVVRRAHAQSRLSRLSRQTAYSAAKPRHLSLVEYEG
jgi:hypothetical protein